MNLFKKRSKLTSASSVQTVSSHKNLHPFSELENYMPCRDGELRIYKLLREAVPIIDAAINKTVRLVGGFSIRCENENIEKELNEFLKGVPVNACEHGIEAFIASYLDQMITYGTAVGEIIPNIQENGIAALYNASLKDVELKTESGPIDLKVYVRDEKGRLTPIRAQEFIVVSALNPEQSKVYGRSVLKGLPFVSKILLNIYNTIGVNWERVGNVRFAVTYKPNSESGEKAYAKERAMQIAAEWQKAMNSKGGVSDFVSVGDVSIKVIGADNQVLDSQVPVKQMLEQIVAKMGIPPFILGLSWSTTEKMSTQQADILTSELESYRRLLNPVISKVCSMWMAFNGYSERFKIEWDNINLQDEVELANSRLITAKAKEIEQRLEMQK